MKLIFLVGGRYRDGSNLFKVTPEDIENKVVFVISEKFGDELVDAKRAKQYIPKPVKDPDPEPTLEDVEKMTVPELKAYAEKNKIDLGDSSKKDELLEKIKVTFEKK